MAKAPTPSSSPNFEGMSLDELTHLHHTVGKHLEERKAARIRELQAELEALGASASTGGGHTVGNSKKAVKAEAGGKGRAKPPVTHRGPNGETWTSRGAKPRWLSALIAEGRSIDEFKVKG